MRAVLRIELCTSKVVKPIPLPPIIHPQRIKGIIRFRPGVQVCAGSAVSIAQWICTRLESQSRSRVPPPRICRQRQALPYDYVRWCRAARHRAARTATIPHRFVRQGRVRVEVPRRKVKVERSQRIKERKNW